MTEPLIRPIAPGDRDAWRAMFTAYGIFYETDFSSTVLDGVWAWLMDAAHDVSALVAQVDRPEGPRLVGFAHLRRLHDTFTAGPAWSLDDLYVVPEERGAGIARALIAACDATAHAAGGGTLRWITASNNDTAQRLYDTVATRTTWVTYEKGDLMQLGTRWNFGEEPPAKLSPVMVGAIADVETELDDGAAEGVDPSSWSWTLTWLEGRAVVELDDGTVLHHDPATDTVTREDPVGLGPTS